ncbi:creatininase family protein [Clostridiales bacterium COT073_COT-073]|nr:creatininase family protein [Clostridiales bacterium COT073_COT-073]
MKLEDLYQKEITKVNCQNIVALLPIGAIEVHGEHLPLGTDNFLAVKLAEKIEYSLGNEKALVLPLIPYGQVWSLKEAPGSIHIAEDILSEYIAMISESIARMKIKKLAIINSHVGNIGAIRKAARKLYEQNIIQAFYFTYPGTFHEIEKVCESPLPHPGYFHACEIETSYMLYLCEEKVKMEKAICQYPNFPPDFDYTPIPWTKIMDTAVLGDAAKATKEKGKFILDACVERIVSILRSEKT